MAKKAQTAAAAPGMSDETVKLKTGKTWSAWFSTLDKHGAAERDHRGSGWTTY